MGCPVYSTSHGANNEAENNPPTIKLLHLVTEYVHVYPGPLLLPKPQFRKYFEYVWGSELKQASLIAPADERLRAAPNALYILGTFFIKSAKSPGHGMVRVSLSDGTILAYSVPAARCRHWFQRIYILIYKLVCV